jgi:2'-5' RNA ligase
VRWIQRANLHVTLRFLGGEVPSDLITPLDARLREITAGISAFEIDACGVGAFPDSRYPKIIWIGLQSETLIRLAEQLEAASRESGFDPESRPYSPHLTIGRVRNMRARRQIRTILTRDSCVEFGTSRIEHLSLYRSVIGGPSAIYYELARYPLTQA